MYSPATKMETGIFFCYEFETKEVRQLTHSIGNEWDPNFGATDEDLWYAGTFGFNDGIFYRKIKL